MKKCLLALLLVPGVSQAACKGVDLLYCQTSNTKILEVCQFGEVVTYAFGPKNKPELAFSVSSKDVRYFPWDGFGRNIHSQLMIPSPRGDAQYVLYQWSERDPEAKTPFGAGVEVVLQSGERVDIACKTNKPMERGLEEFVPYKKP